MKNLNIATLVFGALVGVFAHASIETDLAFNCTSHLGEQGPTLTESYLFGEDNFALVTNLNSGIEQNLPYIHLSKYVVALAASAQDVNSSTPVFDFSDLSSIPLTYDLNGEKVTGTCVEGGY